MWLVLCHVDDLAGIWAFQGLTARGLTPLELVTAECLAASLRWEHRVGNGVTWLDVRLADGRRIRSDEVRGALNRIHVPALQHWQLASEKDRDYVLQEMHGFYSSWLYGLPGKVLNPATAEGLCGAWRHDVAWAQLAARAGLPARPCRRGGPRKGDEEVAACPEDAARTVIVVDGTVTNPSAPDAIASACTRLAELARTPLLGIDFEVGPAGEWTFAAATPMPDLRKGGARLLDALATSLQAPRAEAGP